jgi:nicotinamidase-related amidase
MTHDTRTQSIEVPSAPSLEVLREQRLAEILNPDHAALLIVDLQNDFLSTEGKSAALWHQDVAPMQAVLPKIETVANQFYQKGRPVIRTVTYEDPELRTEAGRDRFLWFEDNDREGEVACLKGTWGAELYVPARDGDVIVEKDRISAYVGTRLHDVLAEHSIQTLVVVGLKTQRCVARTVQDLSDNEPNLHVVVLEDCVSSDDQTQHEATLTEMRRFYPPVITSDILASAWSKVPQD